MENSINEGKLKLKYRNWVFEEKKNYLKWALFYNDITSSIDAKTQ